MTDVVDMIMSDHREVERLFDQLMTQPESQPLVLPTVTALLVAHSRAEEAEVYPAARKEAGEEDEVAHSQEEHREAEEILERLAAMEPNDAGYEAAVQELIDAVKHHVEEEESEVLPGLREQLSADRLAELGEAFARVRAEHLDAQEPGELTREQLQQQAANMGVSGGSSMSKAQLENALDAQSSGEDE
jgi:hypothetical protein